MVLVCLANFTHCDCWVKLKIVNYYGQSTVGDRWMTVDKNTELLGFSDTQVLF